MTGVHSRLYSLAEIAREEPAWQFNVPIYQRLYVWGDDQVETLLSDIVNAFERKAPLFFLGGTVLVEQAGNAHVRRFDLIDGQQRFTTLWLLCCAWGGALAPFTAVPAIPAGTPPAPRLGFAIRPAVDRLLRALAQGSMAQRLPDAAGAEKLEKAMQRMVDKRGAKVDWAGLTRFVFEQVKFVVTRVPRKTDLNKLFEVINNRGVQLQHHEILKARMLEALDEAERRVYARMWDACADMDNYVERTLSAVSGLPAYRVCEELHLKTGLAHAQAVVRLLANRGDARGAGGVRTLAEILDSRLDKANRDGGDAGGAEHDGRVTRVRSIVSFPLLLQHALRIWRFENGLTDLPRVLDRELLALFQKYFADEADDGSTGVSAKVRAFLDLLWRLRVVFDAHVIKWVDQGEDEVHLIGATSVGTSAGHTYMTRSADSDAHRGMALLQSMLYHSQEITTHYWLTPFLLQLHRNEGAETEEHFRYLQHLDNHLLGSAADGSLAVRTRSFMEQPWQVRPSVHGAALRQPDGVRFAHYWFYKLEFVLWFQKLRNLEAWRRFRLTAKNSVEHISPQTPTQRDDNAVTEAMLDRFGNLALVSRSINSEYGNLPFNEKRQRFLNKNKLRLDSLKMALIYESPIWNDEIARAHQREMIDCLDRYVLACDAQRPDARPPSATVVWVRDGGGSRGPQGLGAGCPLTPR